MNIISNAIDALLEKKDNQPQSDEVEWKPQITIHTAVVERLEKDWASITIANNGPGIPLDIQTRIFESFFTTKPIGKGTGLGLAISHQIVTEKHGGQLLLRSHPANGTEFEILLPL